MALWLVRAGPNGERETYALEHGVAVIGWDELGDLSSVDSRDAVLDRFHQTRPDDDENRLRNWASQVWAFAGRIEVDDLVVLPSKSSPTLAVGRVTGPYQYNPSGPEQARHQRPVDWLRDDLPKQVVGQDLRYSLGAFLTVCQITRNDAERRFRNLLEHGSDPGVNATLDGAAVEDDAATPNPEDLAIEQIRDLISRHFQGHDLARLVADLLKAQGYKVETSPPGPDGGMDILAGAGPLGFDAPRLCVQVKSSAGPSDVRVIRELQGVMQTFGADQGLFVSWAGYRRGVEQEARRSFFSIRLWDSDDLIRELLANYEHLPDRVRALLPLKRIWVAVPEE